MTGQPAYNIHRGEVRQPKSVIQHGYVYSNRRELPTDAGFPKCFPWFTRRCGCGITAGQNIALHCFFRAAPAFLGRRASQFRLRPGCSALRSGSGAVVTPMAAGASKGDVGKGRASPASLPKVLEDDSGKTLQRFGCLPVLRVTAGERRSKFARRNRTNRCREILIHKNSVREE